MIEKIAHRTSQTSQSMGNNIAKSIIPPPLSLQACLVDGRLDIARYLYYRRRQEWINNSSKALFQINKKRKHENIATSSVSNIPSQQRSTKRYKLTVRDRNGSIREIKPEDTLWYLLYVATPPSSERLCRLFRTRFRLPLTVPFAIRRLNQFPTHNRNNQHRVDISIQNKALCRQYERNGVREVPRMPLSLFRQCLITHFDIRYKRNEITWPKR